MDSLLYKIHNDPYYQDVRVDYNAVEELPKNATYISHMLKYGQSHGSNHTHTHTHTFLENIYKKKTWNLHYL